MRFLTIATAGAAALLALAACDTDGDSTGTADAGHEEHGLEEEACEHFEEGPFEDVTATADGTGAPDVSKGHTTYRIALVDVTGGKGGSVSYAVAEAGELALFLTKDVPVAVTGPDGNALTAEATEKGSEACDAIGASHVFDVGVGTVTIAIGPTTEATVSAVIEAGAHEE